MHPAPLLSCYFIVTKRHSVLLFTVMYTVSQNFYESDRLGISMQFFTVLNFLLWDVYIDLFYDILQI